MSDDDVWPATEFNPGRERHLHAIGLFSLLFVQFQGSLEYLYLTSLAKRGIPRKLAVFFYKNLTEEKRTEAIKLIFYTQELGYDIQVVEAIDNLIEFFKWSSNCRNNILHAEQYPASFGSKKDMLYLTKKTKDRDSIYMKFGLEQLRSIADRTREGVRQAAAISLHLRYRGTDPKDIPNPYKAFQILPPLLKIPKHLKPSKTP